MKVLDFSEDTPLEELRVAAESFRSIASDGAAKLSGLAGKLRELLPVIAESFITTQRVGTLADLKDLTGEEKKVLKKLEATSFAQVRQWRAHTPEGFEGNFLAYSEALLTAATNLKKINESVLQPYVVFLATLIGTEDMSKLTADRKHLYVKMDKERTSDNHAFGSFFAKHAETTCKIGDVMARNADWAPLLANVRQAQKAVNSVDRKELTEGIEQAEEYLNDIYKKLVTGKMESVTPETSKALAEGAYQIASQIEHYSLVHFRTLVFGEAVSDTLDQIQSILS